MLTMWTPVLTGVALVVAGELLWLDHQRRSLVLDPQRRRFLAPHKYTTRLQGTETPGERAGGAAMQPAPMPLPPLPEPGASARTAPPLRPSADEGIVYVDAQGRITFANQVARDLLHWSAGELALRDVLGGGATESAVILEALAREGLIARHVTTLTGAALQPVEMRAVALRDRDDNFWGAAVFIRRPPVARPPE